MTDNIHDERRARVRLETLIALERVSGYMLAENILFADTNLRLSPPASLSEFRAELKDLEQMGLVVVVADPLGGPRRVKITSAGRAEIAAQQ
jgi:hypothetical protein